MFLSLGIDLCMCKTGAHSVTFPIFFLEEVKLAKRSIYDMRKLVGKTHLIFEVVKL